MGQKSNLLTLRNYAKINLCILESKAFSYSFKFLSIFEKFLQKNGILLTDKSLTLDGTQIRAHLILVIRSSKITFLKKKRSLVLDSFKLSNFPKQIVNLFLTNFKFLRVTSVFLKIKILNQFINRTTVALMYKNLRRFLNTIFSRRFNLFLDFLKISALFYHAQVSAEILLKILGEIFRVLPKKKHNSFLYFLRALFSLLVISKNKNTKSSIHGIKLLINGKIQGKTRASSTCIQVGSTPIQSISKNIEFTKAHIYTMYGAFGFQMWVYRSKGAAI